MPLIIFLDPCMEDIAMMIAAPIAKDLKISIAVMFFPPSIINILVTDFTFSAAAYLCKVETLSIITRAGGISQAIQKICGTSARYLRHIGIKQRPSSKFL